MKKEKMINEAIERMQILGLLDSPEESVIREFKENNKVFLSKSTDMVVNGTIEKWGILFELSDVEKKLVELCERKKNILVYHLIKNATNVGLLYSMLYVSGYDEDEECWPIEKEEMEGIERGTAITTAYVWSAGFAEEHEENLLNGYGEYGSIIITKGEGGLYREI